MRELANALERGRVLSPDGQITPEHLGLAPGGPNPAEGASLNDYFRRFVRENQGRMTETELARALGISRKTLWERRQRDNLPRP